MDSQCNWLNGSSKARKEERRGGVFFWVYVTPRVRPDITEQIEAESCSYPAVCSAAPRECGLLPSSQQTISLSPSLLLALFSSSSRLSCTTETLPFSSIDPAVPFLFSRLSPLPSSYTTSWPVLQSQATPDLTPPGRNSQPCHSSQGCHPLDPFTLPTLSTLLVESYTGSKGWCTRAYTLCRLRKLD